MNKTLALHHVCLPVSDLNRSELFYEKILKLKKCWTFTLAKEHAKQLYNIDDDCCFSTFDCSPGKLELCHAPSVDVKPVPGQHFALSLSDRRLFLEHLKKDAIPLFDISREGRHIVFIKDPDGHLIELKEG